jgi:dTDP-4-amino-4,6-dideoxygalactose transaminase
MKDQLAVNGGPKTIEHPFRWPIFDESDVEAVTSVARSGFWGNPDCGGLVAKFEQEWAQYCGANYALTCVNGSVALRIALIACGVRPGDEVIVPPYTFIATASTILECNCVPVFVDIDEKTYNLNPDEVEKALTPRTKAIIPVHFAGKACDMDAIASLASKHQLLIIEDAAHAHGAEYKGKKLGSIGDVGCFSFQSSKNLTSGEGGIIITDNRQLYEAMNSLRNVGRVSGGEWYEHHILGCNYRMTELQAALLLKQLTRLEQQTRLRNNNGLYLNSLLGEIDGVQPLERGHGETLHSQHLFIFKYDKTKFGNLPKRRFSEMLAAEGVPAFMGYPEPLYRQPLFKERNFMCYAIPEDVDFHDVKCPEAEKACYEEAVWIFQQAMLGSRSDMELIAKAILKVQHAMNS